MTFSAVVMLLFAVVVIYGGLFVTINKAINSSDNPQDDKN